MDSERTEKTNRSLAGAPTTPVCAQSEERVGSRLPIRRFRGMNEGLLIGEAPWAHGLAAEKRLTKSRLWYGRTIDQGATSISSAFRVSNCV